MVLVKEDERVIGLVTDPALILLICYHLPLARPWHFKLVAKYSCACKHIGSLVGIISKIIDEGEDTLSFHDLLKLDSLPCNGFLPFALKRMC